jgi:uncharacterized protein (DUF433 family)
VKTFDIETLRRTPAYSFAEAAHYIDLPTSTLRAWCLGQDYAYKGQRRHFRPLIQLDGGRHEGPSFLNLVEAHVLAAIRRVYGVPLSRVRKALDYVITTMKVERPLADAQFQTNGVDLFVEALGREIINVSMDGQLEMASMLRAHLKRVQRDAAGVPIKLFPFTGRQAIGEAPAPVEIDPRIAFGRPVLKGRTVPTAVLADRFKAGDSLQNLAGDYGASTEEIEEAIRCELDRRAAA